MSVFITVNGILSERLGVYTVSLIVQFTALVLITLLVLLKRERIFTKRYPWFFYLGGAIGVFLNIANVIAFSRISVTAILALMLFGQSIAGILIDQFGLFGMQKHKFAARKLFGLALVLCGIASMMSSFEILAVILSLGAGVCLVLSRTFNAKLAVVTNIRISGFYNYFVGFLVSIPVYLILGAKETALIEIALSLDWYVLIGGVLAVAVAVINNITVVKVSAFYLTLLVFIGQVFSSIIIDTILLQEFSIRIIIGGVFVTAGLCLNLLLDRKETPEKIIE